MNAKREAMIVTKMRIVQTQLALTTARAGLATQAMGAFVKVKIWETLDNNDLNQRWSHFNKTFTRVIYKCSFCPPTLNNGYEFY